MFTHDFEDVRSLALGASVGLVFGFLLQIGGVTRYNVIINQFRFRDFTVLKTMLTAIVVGAIGVWTMLGTGAIHSLHVKDAALAMNAIGGAIFGVGMALLGYCPGTALGAIGQGSRDAIVGVLGALVGSAVYAEVYPAISRALGSIGDLGKVTFADITKLSPWWFVAALAAGTIAICLALELRDRRIRPGRSAD